MKYKKPKDQFSDRKIIQEFQKKYPDFDYGIEKILDDRIFNKKLQYKIRWENWPPEHDSWEPAENFNASELIRDYQQSRGGVASDVTPAVIKLSKTRPKHNRAANQATQV